MAQSAGREYTEQIEELERKKAATAARVSALDRERDEAKKMLDEIEKSRKLAIFQALDSIKKRYFSRLLGDKGVKVKAPKVSSVEESTLGKITTIPKIVQRNMNEIEIQPIVKNFSYVRVLYDTLANEYYYEAIEPKLLEEEAELLEVIKEILVENLELLEDADRVAKENYLRRIVDGLIRELVVELHPVSKERIMYYVFRDFIRYGPIDVVMTDPQVEDVSCDGVRVPFCTSPPARRGDPRWAPPPGDPRHARHEARLVLHDPTVPGEPLHPPRPRPLQDDVARDDGVPLARGREPGEAPHTRRAGG